MQTKSSLEQEYYPSGLTVFTRLFLLASAMVAISYGILAMAVAAQKWMT